MPTATCHCGAVRLDVARAPQRLTDCNCSICRRYGALWAYYRASAVHVTGATAIYRWGDRILEFHRCRVCGCVTHHARTKGSRDSTVGVNARNFDPAIVAKARIRHLDGASTWKYLD
jgi:hypothetical protein